ncbi:MAG: oxygen-independent coproporphyrinogen III oxidase [Lewinella sp.]|nr:oxygen-independent coproporphyrinogen III oxidase [Lewinella sp.]
MNSALLAKYDQPVPRYTSYPTVPYWSDAPPSEEAWVAHLREAYERSPEVSLYIHLPFCERLCTYCGCNKRITRNHAVEQPYIEAVLAEWQLYLQALPGKPVLRELHLGGGTPTFFSPDNLERLLLPIFASVQLSDDFAGSFEAHPATATYAHLLSLKELGFRRLSIGVQDLNPEIMRLINRGQTEAEVRQLTQWARRLGYDSINYDFIFGLPRQTAADIAYDVKVVEEMRPDRIAFYSYAHVPWNKPSQRAYSEKDLPLGAAKRALYEEGCDLLEAAGYHEIGLDHFALPTDELYLAWQAGTLHRNFMGYTPAHTDISLALGASAISDVWTAFAQNEKGVERYQERALAGEFPFIKGYELTADDRIIRRKITQLMCTQRMEWADPTDQTPAFLAGLDRLGDLEKDGLIRREGLQLEVTEEGRPFLRNIALAFDEHYWAARPAEKVFSQGV